ncbi:ribonuclease J [Anaerocaecibacter muris]|uniref:ribonuclease J n=1 Tax=Anaerocaecibacter muris TaxID=2941513 RepID=UPI00203BEA4F|nr:ribonuclease J [Anaerocaecibacter muris]
MQQKKFVEPVLKVIFLGGVGEIGKNMTALEFGEDIIIIDCGSTFPTSDTPGVDLIIPDPAYLLLNKDKIRGIVITHGHEDHIGSVPYFLKECNVPVYGTRLTLTLIENKLREMRIDNAKLNVVQPGNVISLGRAFKVEFVKVSHSIAGSCALSVSTPVGTVFHTGDFKVDYTPIDGNMIDLQRIAEIGKQGVLLLLCESTNVERPGTSMSEATVGRSMRNIFNENKDRRLIIATFASNIHRLQQIIDLAAEFGRKVAFSGRSMINVAECAARIGELKIDRSQIIDIEKVKNVDDKDLVILTTGSQGEPMSALTRMASDDFSKVKLGYNDTVILSAHPIPGNERMVYSVINNVYRHGARVIYESLAELHVSGHACRDELSLMHALLKPQYFIPVHGEHRHLQKHAELAVAMGEQPSHIIITDIGDCVYVSHKTFKIGEQVASGSLLVDGLGVGDTDSSVLRDRKHLAEDGLLIAVICIDELSGTVSAIDITSRGFAYDKEGGDDFFESCREAVARILSGMDLRDCERNMLNNTIRKELKNYIFKKTRRSPMILPMVIDC